MKTLRIVIVAVILLAAVLFTAYQLFFRASIPDYTGKLAVAGLLDEVTVKTDKYGVPHIIAKNEHDLFFAQGYIIARERMFQMDTTRLAGRGELSTLFGKTTLGKDRFLKTVGFHRLARAGYRAMSPEARKILDAYTAGVNAYITGTERLPREYVILGARPPEWTPEDCVATVLLMSYSLTRSKKVDLVLHEIAREAGPEILNLLMPSYPDFAPTLTGERRYRSSRDSGGIVRQLFSRTGPVEIPEVLPFCSEIPASNWMAFSKEVTESGHAIFTGSPDLKPTLPALFYMIHLKGGGYDVAGGSLPGVPGIGPLGYNGRIAWSAVNGRGDEMDYFLEKINPDNPGQYLTESGYRDYTVRSETLRIKTKDGIREESLEVKVTRHGPIISEVIPGAPENCAMKWAVFDNPFTDIEGLLKMNRAANFREFRAALSVVRNINLGLGYADAEGNVGWQFIASPPIRKKGEGSLLVPGWTGEYDWTGYVPYERLPYDFNPGPGYVASFNNEPGNVDYHLTNYYLFERAIRFREMMESRGSKKVSYNEARDMQLDTVSVVAERWVPLILDACGDETYDRYVSLLREWDFAVQKESVAATLFNAFYYNLMKNTFIDDVGEKIWNNELRKSYLYYIPDLAITRIINEGEHALFDDTRTTGVSETRDDVIRRSMEETVEQLADRLGNDSGKWRWKRVHLMAFDHPLGSKLSFFNLKPIPTDGSHHTINSGFWDTGNPFMMDSGGVIRIAVDFSDPESATIISPPGQSGHYLSRHYDDLARMWADGKQIPLRFTTYEELPYTLKLTPGE